MTRTRSDRPSLARAPSTRRTLALGLALGLFLATGCERPADREPESEAEALAETEGEVGPETGEDTLEVSRDTAEVPATASVAEEPELRTYRLLLVNPGEDEAVVHASAGAGRVVLDTVPGRDSARVDVEVRAERVLLEAADARGRSLGSEEIELREEALSRWVIPWDADPQGP